MRILVLLLPNRGESDLPFAEKRRTVNGVLWVLRTDAPWRDLPELHGKWNSDRFAVIEPLRAQPRGTACGKTEFPMPEGVLFAQQGVRKGGNAAENH